MVMKRDKRMKIKSYNVILEIFDILVKFPLKNDEIFHNFCIQDHGDQ